MVTLSILKAPPPPPPIPLIPRMPLLFLLFLSPLVVVVVVVVLIIESSDSLILLSSRSNSVAKAFSLFCGMDKERGLRSVNDISLYFFVPLFKLRARAFYVLSLYSLSFFFWRDRERDSSTKPLRNKKLCLTLNTPLVREECCIIISRFKKARRHGDVGEG